MSAQTHTVGLRDLPVLLMPGRRAPLNQAVTLDRPAGDGLVSLRGVLERGILPRRGQAVWVSRENGGLQGLAAVRRRAGRSVWEVDTLAMRELDEAALLDLLDRLVASAGADGALRLFLRLPAQSPLVDVAMRHGFAAITRETLYEIPAPPTGGSTNAAEVRARHRSDEPALFRLFTRAVPQDLRWHIALTPAEWRASQEALGGPREWVVPSQDGVAALIRVGRDSRGTVLQFLTEPDRGLASTAVAFATAQCAARPVRVLVPEYAAAVAEALEEAGFAARGDTVVLVRPIAQRARRLALNETTVEGNVRPVIQ